MRKEEERGGKGRKGEGRGGKGRDGEERGGKGRKGEERGGTGMGEIKEASLPIAGGENSHDVCNHMGVRPKELRNDSHNH